MKIGREFEDTKQILSVNNGNIFLFELAFRLLTLPLLLQMPDNGIPVGGVLQEDKCVFHVPGRTGKNSL